MNILLVDNDLDSLKLLQYSLGYFDNIQISQTRHFKETIDLCFAKDFDLAIVDSNLENEDAIKLIFAIKETGKNIFIVASSYDRTSFKIHEMLKAGASDFMHKPYVPHLLRNRFNNYIKIIESRKYSAVYKKSLNLFNEPCYPFFSTFKVVSEDDLVYFWDFMSELHINNCNLGTECRVDCALKAVYSVTMAMLRLASKLLIFVEQNDYCYYFTLNGIRGLNEKIISELIEKDIGTHKDIRYIIDVSKLSIEAYTTQNLPACNLESKKDFVSHTISVEKTPDLDIKVDNSTKLQVFDFIEHDDLRELQDYLNDLDSSLAPLQYSSLNETETLYPSDAISKISNILSGYSETYNISVALRSLALDIKDNMEAFLQKSHAIANLLIFFDSDLKSWQKSLFEIGAPSINYMDDSIIANAVSISNMLKPADAVQDDSLDDIFMF